jgi:hypothetical protein
MYDVVIFEREVSGIPTLGRRFQTQSFESCMDIYAVTETGRLCLIGNDFRDRGEPAGPGAREEVDIDFHGDIRLMAKGPDTAGSFDKYVARFTHGTLEWMRPEAEAPPTEFTLKRFLP